MGIMNIGWPCAVNSSKLCCNLVKALCNVSTLANICMIAAPNALHKNAVLKSPTFVQSRLLASKEARHACSGCVYGRIEILSDKITSLEYLPSNFSTNAMAIRSNLRDRSRNPIVHSTLEYEANAKEDSLVSVSSDGSKTSCTI